MMIKNILFTAWLMTTASLTAQMTFDLPTDYVRGQIFSINSLTNGAGYNGSPYLKEEFTAGRIYMGENSYPGLLRYNSYAGAFEIKTGEQDFGQLQQRAGMKVKVGNRNFEMVALPDGNNAFLEKLTDGTLTLWAHRTASFQPAREAKSSYDTGRPAEFSQDTDYFVGAPGSLQEIKLRKKDLQDLTAGKEKEIKDFAKKRRLKWGDEGDVVKLLTYYNGL